MSNKPNDIIDEQKIEYSKADSVSSLKSDTQKENKPFRTDDNERGKLKISEERITPRNDDICPACSVNRVKTKFGDMCSECNAKTDALLITTTLFILLIGILIGYWLQ